MFIRIVNGLPEECSMSQLRLEHPNTSFPIEMTDADLAGYGLYKVKQTPFPSHDPLRHRVQAAAPIEVDGEWVQQWSVVDLSPDEQIQNLEAARAKAFQAEADPLFFEWQAGEGTQEAWLERREEIRARYPYPQG